MTDSMIGLKMPDYSRISPRVATVLGQNPSPFTGPGTNTYIVGTSKRPILLDTGQGVAIYSDLLETALKELSNRTELERIVLTHAHVDHLGGVKQVTREIRRDGSAQDAVGGSRRSRRRDFGNRPRRGSSH